MYLIDEIQFVETNEDEIIMLNLINAAADVINNEIYYKIKNNINELDDNVVAKLKERKYLFDTKEEYETFVKDLDLNINKAEKNSLPCFLVIPTYNCNLRCTYCYERTYKIEKENEERTIKIIDEQYKRINEIVEKYKEKNKGIDNKLIRITIMGGEPLLKTNKNIVKHIIDMAKQKGYTIDAVTNGVDLDEFVDLLDDDCVDHIQVTLDGSRNIHDKRRIFANGKGSFDIIIKNIELALNRNIKIFLRVNVDNENINDLPELAKILTNKFNNNEYLKPYIYLLQDGGCSGDANVVKEEVGIERIFAMEKNNPEMAIFRKKFHPEAFINSIFENQKFQPNLRHCGASMNQYIFDCKGNTYKCWHGIGNDAYRTGVYLPYDKANEEKVNKWENRSTSKLKKCSSCKYRYICGTGCPAATHKGENEFDIEKESCVDYEKLIDTIIKEKMKQVE